MTDGWWYVIGWMDERWKDRQTEGQTGVQKVHSCLQKKLLFFSLCRSLHSVVPLVLTRLHLLFLPFSASDLFTPSASSLAVRSHPGELWLSFFFFFFGGQWTRLSRRSVGDKRSFFFVLVDIKAGVSSPSLSSSSSSPLPPHLPSIVLPHLPQPGWIKCASQVSDTSWGLTMLLIFLFFSHSVGSGSSSSASSTPPHSHKDCLLKPSYMLMNMMELISVSVSGGCQRWWWWCWGLICSDQHSCSWKSQTLFLRSHASSTLLLFFRLKLLHSCTPAKHTAAAAPATAAMCSFICSLHIRPLHDQIVIC